MLCYVGVGREYGRGSGRKQKIVVMCLWGSGKPEGVRHGNHKVKVSEPPLLAFTFQPTITTKVQSFYFQVSISKL